jgi:putative FmdB family regulatory protein
VPLYEYECESGHRFERIQKFSDPPIDKCPTCESTVRKLLSSPAIQFKGSGWYITDYAKKGKGEAKASGDAAPKEGGDAKPAAGQSETAPASKGKDKESGSTGRSKAEGQ